MNLSIPAVPWVRGVLLILLSLGLIQAQENCPRYQRSEYEHWIDEDLDGLDTRKEVLSRQNQRGSGWREGEWFDPYTARTFTARESLQIDHVVALSEAHQSGAWAWNASQKRRFANDMTPGHLIAVHGPTNEAKGDKDPAQWMPPNYRYWKEYARNWLAVKMRWDLSIDEAEQWALRKYLGTAADSVPWPRIEEERHCGDKVRRLSRAERLAKNSAFQDKNRDCCKRCRPGKSQPCGDHCIPPAARCREEKGCACWR